MTGPRTGLRVVVLGTPAFAVPSLRALARTATIVAVVTQPDRPAGRGQRLVPPPVAEAARALGLTVLQPETLRDPTVQGEIASLRPDLLVAVAYGRLIPPAVLTVPPLGGINVHPSLLPRYRGASPIQAAIRDGATITGVTIMYLTNDLDAGDIILQRDVPIGPEETAGELEARLADIGAALLAEAVALIARGDAPRRPQDHAAATYAGKITKADGQIIWDRPAPEIVNHVRAMNPWPCAFTTWPAGTLRIWRARAVEGTGAAGQVLAAGDADLVVAAGPGAVALLEVQAEGGRRMTAREFLRGHTLHPGTRLGTLAGGGPDTLQ
jgi:methionyl-tRNA formyltransferase